MPDSIVVPVQSQIKLSLLTHYVAVGKIFNLVGDELQSDVNGQLINAQIENLVLDHIYDIGEVLTNITGYQHLCRGVAPQPIMTVLPANKLEDNPGCIARNDKSLKNPTKKNGGLLTIDVDGSDPIEAYHTICEVFPVMVDVPCVIASSSSSNIYERDPFVFGEVGREIRGNTGGHIFFALDNAKRVPDVLEHIHKHLLINGHSECRPSAIGGFLERTLADQMMAGTSQPIYGKANLSGNLIQKKTVEYFGEIFNDRLCLCADDFPKLNQDEINAYRQAVALEKNILAEEMLRVRTQWLKSQPDNYSANMCLQNKILTQEFVIDMRNFGLITVGKLGAEHDGETLRCPYDDGHGSYTKAMYYHNPDGTRFINSMSSGGIIFKILDTTKMGFGDGVDIPPPPIPQVDMSRPTPDSELKLPPPALTADYLPVTDVPVNLPVGDQSDVVAVVNNGQFVEVVQAHNELLDSSIYEADKQSMSGKPMMVFENFNRLMYRYGVTIHRNIINDEIVYKGLGISTDNDNINNSYVTDLCIQNQFNGDGVNRLIQRMAFENEFNPVEMMIKQKKWDCVDRVVPLFSTLDVISDDVQVEFDLFVKWAVGTIRIALRLSDSQDGCLVLQSNKGGTGKSRWLRRLATHKNLFVSTSFDPKNKDELIKSTTKWICELGELDSLMNTGDVKALMQHITNESDTIRTPFSRSAVNRPRRTSYCGSVNSEKYLKDSSGDRRFWTIRVGYINYQHDIDMQQFWSQIYEQYVLNPDYVHYLSPEENEAVIKRNREQFSVQDPIVEHVENYFNRAIVDSDNLIMLNATEIGIKLGFNNLPRYKLTAIKDWLKFNGYEEKQHRENGRIKKGFWIPKFAENIM